MRAHNLWKTINLSHVTIGDMFLTRNAWSISQSAILFSPLAGVAGKGEAIAT